MIWACHWKEANQRLGGAGKVVFSKFHEDFVELCAFGENYKRVSRHFKRGNANAGRPYLLPASCSFRLPVPLIGQVRTTYWPVPFHPRSLRRATYGPPLSLTGRASPTYRPPPFHPRSLLRVNSRSLKSPRATRDSTRLSHPSSRPISSTCANGTRPSPPLQV